MNTKEQLNDHRVKIRKLLLDSNVNYMLVGLLLAKGIEEKHHGMLDYKRVEDYWEHEFGLRASTGWNYVRVARMFAPIMSEGEAPPDITRLIKLLSLLTKADQDEVMEWFNKARALSPKDFNKEILVAQNKPDQDICEHKEIETWERCKKCGRWLGVKK